MISVTHYKNRTKFALEQWICRFYFAKVAVFFFVLFFFDLRIFALVRFFASVTRCLRKAVHSAKRASRSSSSNSKRRRTRMYAVNIPRPKYVMQKMASKGNKCTAIRGFAATLNTVFAINNTDTDYRECPGSSACPRCFYKSLYTTHRKYHLVPCSAHQSESQLPLACCHHSASL